MGAAASTVKCRKWDHIPFYHAYHRGIQFGGLRQFKKRSGCTDRISLVVSFIRGVLTYIGRCYEVRCCLGYQSNFQYIFIYQCTVNEVLSWSG